MMDLIFFVVFSYLLGSIPTGFILSKVFFDKDLRQSGSGNIGTFNFWRVTHSKTISMVVLFIDVFKGYLALWLSSQQLRPELLIFPSMAVVVGHIYPVWLKGQGGRGLATLGGVFIYIYPIFVVSWVFIFAVLYKFSKRYILAGLSALFILNILAAFFYMEYFFIILSSNSLIVMLQYRKRLIQEIRAFDKNRGGESGS
jgi:glycerol-3-phosphate acyltransferase PlsY